MCPHILKILSRHVNKMGKTSQAVVEHVINPSTREAGAGGVSVSLGLVYRIRPEKDILRFLPFISSLKMY